MAISIIDKIKQKNELTFSLIDYIDINGRITGWQNPIKQIFGDVASITGLMPGDTFIVRDVGGEWSQFAGKDIYDRVTEAIPNAIYILGEPVGEGPELIYFVTAPTLSMVLLDKSDGNLKVYKGESNPSWTNLITGSGAITGKTLKYEDFIVVNTSETATQNYISETGKLSFDYVIVNGDTIKMYVNGIKYTDFGTIPDYTYNSGDMFLSWNATNAGFDLESEDKVIIEIYK